MKSYYDKLYKKWLLNSIFQVKLHNFCIRRKLVIYYMYIIFIENIYFRKGNRKKIFRKIIKLI